jgi:DNA-directed RNA polymerase beta' subunit
MECVSGKTNFIIDSKGKLVKAKEGGQTGIKFLYKNWDHIKFEKKESKERLKKIKLLRSMKKEEIWSSKTLVIPAFFRDIDWSQLDSGRIHTDESNKMYSKLMSLAQPMVEKEMELDFILNTNYSVIQNTLVEIYEYFTGLLKGKNGIIKKNLLGKAIDYSTRSVISCKNNYIDHADKDPISLHYTGIPIAQLCVLFYPFLYYSLNDFFQEFLNNYDEVEDGKGNVIKIHKDADMDYQPVEIEKIIKKFTRNISFRTKPIQIKSEKDKMVNLYYDNDLNMPVTWLHLFYTQMMKIVSDKHVVITRYPIDKLNNTFFSKIHVLTTKNTMEHTVKPTNTFYPFYPIVNFNGKIDFIDTVQFSNSHLSGLGADFDGDMVTIRSIYTKEANEEASKLIESPRSLVDVTGRVNKSLSNEGILGMFELTKD